MVELERMVRLVDAAESIAAELEQLRVLKEHELDVRVEEAPTVTALMFRRLVKRTRE